MGCQLTITAYKYNIICIISAFVAYTMYIGIFYAPRCRTMYKIYNIYTICVHNNNIPFAGVYNIMHILYYIKRAVLSYIILNTILQG